MSEVTTTRTNRKETMTSREAAQIIFDGAEAASEQHATDNGLTFDCRQSTDREMFVIIGGESFRVTVAKVRS